VSAPVFKELFCFSDMGRCQQTKWVQSGNYAYIL